MLKWDKSELMILKHASHLADQLHSELYRFQNSGDQTDGLESQRLLMLADDLREAIFEHIDRGSPGTTKTTEEK